MKRYEVSLKEKSEKEEIPESLWENGFFSSPYMEAESEEDAIRIVKDALAKAGANPRHFDYVVREQKKYYVTYQGGESRYSNKEIDFMLATGQKEDGEEFELYAERDPVDYISEEDREAIENGDVEFEKVKGKYHDFDAITYHDLKSDIISKAKEEGINPDDLEFIYG